MRERTDHKSQPVRHSSPRLRDDIGSPYLSPFDALTLAQGRPPARLDALMRLGLSRKVVFVVPDFYAALFAAAGKRSATDQYC
jgi:hypothetical protein